MDTRFLKDPNNPVKFIRLSITNINPQITLITQIILSYRAFLYIIFICINL